MGEARLKLRKPLERRIREGHPWVYADALESRGSTGEVATLLDRKGRFLARGIAEGGPIGMRVWTLRDEPVDRALLARRIQAATALRDMLNFENTTAWRCLNGEGDRTPGLVVDRYGTEDGVFAVLRLDGALRSVSWVRDTVLEVISAVGFLEKARGQETVHLAGERPPDVIAVREYGMTLLANLWKGQKTGLFLDHREARRRVRALARGRRVLNLYGYTGGFSVAAGLGGAVRVETVDLSKGALELAKRTWEANQSPGHPPFIDTPQSAVSSHPPVVDTAVQSHPPVVDTANSSHPSIVDTNHIAVSSDVQAYLKQDRRSWDFIVADPPSFAPSERAKPKAIEAYTALHTACFHRIAHGGLYLAGSCSSHVTASDFLETLCAAARRAKVNIQILERAGAPADHPRPAAFSEGDYLKTVLARITQ